jgi:hypothetical protein
MLGDRCNSKTNKDRTMSPQSSSLSSVSKKRRHESSSRSNGEELKVRQVGPLHSAVDNAELEKHYSFLPSSSLSTWQDRMVHHYHSHLYKEYVLADLTTRPGQVGLRWRTQDEVTRGKGYDTCGNKHCPSYQQEQSQIIKASSEDEEALLLIEYSTTSEPPATEQDELDRLEKVPPGLGLHDYEVPFEYAERGESKSELVKLRLCLRCAPLLFRTRNPVDCALAARRARLKFDKSEMHPFENTAAALDRSDSSLSSCTDRKRRRRRKKERRRKR